MTEDIVRVLRIIEYVGPRKRVEESVARSIQGSRDCGCGLVINAATIGAYPEIMDQPLPVEEKHGEGCVCGRSTCDNKL